MSRTENTINLIIPTTCERSRASSLNRAIASALTQAGVRVEPIIVVNGTRLDEELYASLRGDPRLRVAYLKLGSLPAALKHGRALVTAPFFCFLDDDDELLPNGLRIRFDALSRDPSSDFIATSWYACLAGRDQLRRVDAETVDRDPLAALVEENWLGSGGALFRTSSVGQSYFEDIPAYYEWTYLAFRLAAALRGRFEEVPTYRAHDTPGSASKSEEYRAAVVPALERIIERIPTTELRQAMRRKLGGVHHELSYHYSCRGEHLRAWRHHFCSLLLPGGPSYLLYSVKLLPFWPKDS